MRGGEAGPSLPSSHPCRGEQRRLCSLPALCHHVAHTITVTAWNGDRPRRARALRLGPVRGAPPANHPLPLLHHHSCAPILCTELWVGVASGNIHTSPEMLPWLPRLYQDTKVA